MAFPQYIGPCVVAPIKTSEVDGRIAVEMRGVPVACHKGCSWCCHQLVVLTCRVYDVRPIDGPRELRQLLTELLDEQQGGET